MMIKIYAYSVPLLFVYGALQSIDLFDKYPELVATVPYVQCASLPTPLEHCHGLGKVLQHNNIFIKRDDATGAHDLYGGNKVRKLEFLLGDALKKGAKRVVTFGCVGTNHGLATACHAQQCGLECLLFLKNQPNSPVVRQNLLLDHYFNAKIQIFGNNQERKVALDQLLENNQDIYFIPTGGSVPLGALGYVNAAFELKKQIQEGAMPEPDFIYVPIGSCGTVAGLLLGMALADLHSKIVAVAIEPEGRAHQFLENIKKLFHQTNKLLNSFCSDVPLLEFPDEQLFINKDFCGTEYGLWLPEGDDATRIMKDEENITVEGTYSAKAVAALICDIKNEIRKSDEIILLWDTYCGLDFSHLTTLVTYKDLIPELHHYFERN